MDLDDISKLVTSIDANVDSITREGERGSELGSELASEDYRAKYETLAASYENLLEMCEAKIPPIAFRKFKSELCGADGDGAAAAAIVEKLEAQNEALIAENRALMSENSALKDRISIQFNSFEENEKTLSSKIEKLKSENEVLAEENRNFRIELSTNLKDLIYDNIYKNYDRLTSFNEFLKTQPDVGLLEQSQTILSYFSKSVDNLEKLKIDEILKLNSDLQEILVEADNNYKLITRNLEFQKKTKYILKLFDQKLDNYLKEGKETGDLFALQNKFVQEIDQANADENLEAAEEILRKYSIELNPPAAPPPRITQFESTRKGGIESTISKFESKYNSLDAILENRIAALKKSGRDTTRENTLRQDLKKEIEAVANDSKKTSSEKNKELQEILNKFTTLITPPPSGAPPARSSGAPPRSRSSVITVPRTARTLQKPAPPAPRE